MDLKETKNIHMQRHPWETARLRAFKNILDTEIFEGVSILDIGCGDGYISRSLFGDLQKKNVTAVDIHLSDEWIHELTKLTHDIKYQRELPLEGGYDLILLLDVIEHIECDKDFLATLVERYVVGKSKILVSAPAYQAIYGRHDVFLGHYRRYNLKSLEALATDCGLKVLSAGYLFFTLLLPKLVFYKLLSSGKDVDGVGRWNRGKMVTRFINIILTIDNGLLISASRLGLHIPGLTGWVLCEKQG